MLDVPQGVLNAGMALCHDLVGNYAAAIVLFTLVTKVILLPVSLWTHRNSIRMVALTPELNRVKIAHFGDADAIAEEQQALYKRERYHPLASTVPLFIQLILLVGVIGAVREVLGGAQSALTLVPSQEGGATLLMPLAAGASALVLGLAQNHLNPLQREQTPASQWATNGVSIGISLFLGAFVPLGVGVYWIASNLLTVAQQALLNRMIPPEKYVDYTALEASKKELAGMNSLGAGVSKEDRAREKADYKRFFSIANKHLVFYSEKSGYYKYWADYIQYILDHTNLTVHYVTSDPKDGIFELTQSRPKIKAYYIGEKRLITLFMKMDADVVVMTMPEIEKYHYKRSMVRKDIEYIYIFHAMVSTHMIYRPQAFDHYDTVFLVGPHHRAEIRETEALYGLPEKRLVEAGYPLLDAMREEYVHLPKHEGYRVLIAPSHHEGNIMDSCLDALLEALSGQGWEIIVRPHPQYIRRNPQKVPGLREKYAGHADIRFEDDFASNDSIFAADVLITDWSGISMEYSFTTLKPCVFINTPMKVLNPEWERYKSAPALLAIRDEIGISVDIEDAGGIAERVAQMQRGELLPEAEIAKIVSRYAYNVGDRGQTGAQYIIRRIQEKSAEKKRAAQA